MSMLTTLLALLIEAIFGYSDRLVASIGHPVMWIGRLIAWLDRVLNRDTMSASSRRLAGVLALLAIIALPGAAAFVIERGLLKLPLGIVAVSIVASSLLAQRSLYRHVARVAAALETDGLERAQDAVAQIVGRDTKVLDGAGVARAAIESLAENFSDGVVAPAFWLAIGGLPAGTVYKAINTADSMVGHRTPRHRDFGFAAARVDDLVNLPASRISALLIVTAAALGNRAAATQAWRAVRQDAHRHRSPNAGYPEAAMAGALGLALAGPRVYGGTLVDDATMGDGRRDATAKDIRAALALYRRADAILIAVVACAAAITLLPG